MTNDSDVHKRQNQGIRAKDLLENKIFINVFRKLEEKYLEDFTNSKPDDTQIREQTYLSLQNLRKLRQEISTLVTDGKIASAQIDNLNKKG